MSSVSITATIAPGRRQLVNVRRQFLLTAKWRVLWLLVLFAVIAASALLRIVLLGVLQPASSRQSMDDALLPARGDIVDRNGVPLARAFPAYSLWFNPKAMNDGGPPLVKSPAEVAAALARIFPGEDPAKLAARLASGEAGYLKRRILPEEANRVHALGEPALESPFETERLYPQGSMASHVLGFVAADGHGRVGMEQVFDQRLTDPISRGTPAMLSLDARVQGALEDVWSVESAKPVPSVPLELCSMSIAAKSWHWPHCPRSTPILSTPPARQTSSTASPTRSMSWVQPSSRSRLLRVLMPG